MNQKFNVSALPVIIFALVIIIVGAAWLAVSNQTETNTNTNAQTTTNINTVAIINTNTTSWAAYTNDTFSFNMKYPNGSNIYEGNIDNNEGFIRQSILFSTEYSTYGTITFNMTVNGARQSNESLAEFAQRLTGDDLLSSQQEVTYNNVLGIQFSDINDKIMIMSTFFTDSAGNYYNIFVEEAAPFEASEILNQEDVMTFSQTFQDQIAEEYNYIINSFEEI